MRSANPVMACRIAATSADARPLGTMARVASPSPPIHHQSNPCVLKLAPRYSEELVRSLRNAASPVVTYSSAAAQ